MKRRTEGARIVEAEDATDENDRFRFGKASGHLFGTRYSSTAGCIPSIAVFGAMTTNLPVTPSLRRSKHHNRMCCFFNRL
jgi:hypothetical protein